MRAPSRGARTRPCCVDKLGAPLGDATRAADRRYCCPLEQRDRVRPSRAAVRRSGRPAGCRPAQAPTAPGDPSPACAMDRLRVRRGAPSPVRPSPAPRRFPLEAAGAMVVRGIFTRALEGHRRAHARARAQGVLAIATDRDGGAPARPGHTGNLENRCRRTGALPLPPCRNYLLRVAGIPGGGALLPELEQPPGERLATTTADGTSMVVEAVAQATVAHRHWLEIHMPVLWNFRTGWVPASAVSPLVPIQTWLVVGHKHLRAKLIDNGRTVFSAPVGMGARGTPTPQREPLRHRSPHPPGAQRPLRPARLRDERQVGDPGRLARRRRRGHPGHNQRQLIPSRPSPGCFRMRNADILRLGRLMPVGTPVTIR